MLLINSLTDDPMQQFVLDGIPGVQINATLRFMPRIQNWIMGITWNDFIAQGIPVLCGPNILRQWRNIIPFGIACTNINQLDPYTLNDFSGGNSSLYLLDSSDIGEVESQFFPGIIPDLS